MALILDPEYELATGFIQSAGLEVAMHRKAANLSIRELGDATGIRFQSLNEFETGRRILQAEELERLRSWVSGHPLPADSEATA